MLPSPEEIESATGMLNDLVNEIRRGRNKEILELAYQRFESLKEAITILSALKSGELVGKEMGHKCPFEKACTCYQHYECNGYETHAEWMSNLNKKALTEKYMSVEEVEKIIKLKFLQMLVQDKPDKQGWTKARIIAQALTRLPKTELMREELVKIIEKVGIKCMPDTTSPHPYYIYPEELADAVLARRGR
jgi:hypothetical protein